jgi:hypothetical protein
MAPKAPASAQEKVTIEVLQNPKSKSTHKGKQLEQGERVEMSRGRAQRHVEAGNATIVTPKAGA